jgi:hypothetical protein
MGTGIVSIGLSLDGREVPSVILLVICAAIWVALTGLQLAGAIVNDSRRLAQEPGDPTALTVVAGTGVLGVRLTMLGWDWAGVALLIVALAVFLGLAPVVLGRWPKPTTGASFLLAVAPESLALLAAELAGAVHAPWLLYAALVPFCLGLGCYAFVLTRFQFRQLAVASGDQWVAGGALAIAAVAVGRIGLDAQRAGVLTGALGVLKTLALVLWWVAIMWLPGLVAAEALHPRPRYGVGRWSTVFPVGMYAACSFTTGAFAGIPGITDFARVWVWLAVAVWLVVFVAMLRRAPALRRRVRER